MLNNCGWTKKNSFTILKAYNISSISIVGGEPSVRNYRSKLNDDFVDEATECKGNQIFNYGITCKSRLIVNE